MADSHAAFARLADASAKLFAEQAAAMAAMTAFGISVAGQMTGLMLGGFRPSEETAAETSPDRSSMGVAETEGNVVHLRSKAEKSGAAARAAKASPRKSAARPAAKSEIAKPIPGSLSMAESSGDDLKRISGIGPRLEKVLNARGITTYAQIAGLKAAALKKIDDDLGLEGRVIRDDWAGQAKALATGGPDAAR